MIEIPWNGPSVIVPAKAIEVLHKFNQNFNYVPLGLCRDCGGCYTDRDGDHICESLSVEGFLVDSKDFCSQFFERRDRCQNSDEERKRITEAQRKWIADSAAKVRARYSNK